MLMMFFGFIFVDGEILVENVVLNPVGNNFIDDQCANIPNEEDSLVQGQFLFN